MPKKLDLAKRRTLPAAQRAGEGIPSPEPPPPADDTAPAAPRRRRSPRRSGGSASTVSRRHVSAVITTDEHDQARGAFLVDQELPDGPTSMSAWVTAALDAHNRRSVAERAAIRAAGAGLTRSERPRPRQWEIASAVVEAAQAARVSDRAGQSLSGYLADALRVAAAAARERAGGTLPPVPPSLPGGPR